MAHVGQVEIFGVNLIAGALARWLGEVEGRASAQLSQAIKGAQIQIHAADGMINTMDPSLTADDRLKILSVARRLVDDARANVRRAAAGVVLAVPREVEQAFDDFGATAVKVANALAEQAKSTIFGVVVLVLLYLAFESRRAPSYD